MNGDQPFASLGNLELEKLGQQFGCHAREKKLRSARQGFYVFQQCANAVSGAQPLARNHGALGQQRFGIAEVHHDIAALQTLDDARDHFALAVLVEVDNLLALRLAHLLHDDLLGGLRGDAAEHDRLERRFDEFTELDVRLLRARLGQLDLTVGELDRFGFVGNHFPATEGVVGSGVAVNDDARVGVALVAFARGGSERGLERLENDFLVHALFARHGIDNHQYFITYHLVLPSRLTFGIGGPTGPAPCHRTPDQNALCPLPPRRDPPSHPPAGRKNSSAPAAAAASSP